jgi:hypothetical protein
LDTLEAREVPAALSFTLPDGTIGSGLFTTPDGVDPTQASQTFSVSDLSVTKNNVVYVVQPGATATYANGVLVGVNAVAFGPDTISLAAGVAQVGPYSAPVAYDGATTNDTFQFPDGTVGALSYTIPWSVVDSSQSSQSLAPTAFNLNIAGQNFAYGSASYTQSPTLVFASGNFVGVSFSLTPPPGFAYTSVTGAFDINVNNIITAVQAGTGQQFVAAPTPQQFVDLNFTNVSTGSDYLIVLNFLDGNKKSMGLFSVKVSKTDSAKDIANNVAASINKTNMFTASANGTDVKIKVLPNGRGWAELDYFTNNVVGGIPIPNPFLTGPTLVRKAVVTVAGQIEGTTE